MTYKPQGYNSVSPYLVVDGASATIDFLTTRGGFRDAIGTTWWIATKVV